MNTTALVKKAIECPSLAVSSIFLVPHALLHYGHLCQQWDLKRKRTEYSRKGSFEEFLAR